MALKMSITKFLQIRLASTKQQSNVVKLGKPGGPKHSGCGEGEDPCSLDADCKTSVTSCKACCSLSDPSRPKKEYKEKDCLVPLCDFKPCKQRQMPKKKFEGQCIDLDQYLKDSFCQTVPRLSDEYRARKGCCKPFAKKDAGKDKKCCDKKQYF